MNPTDHEKILFVTIIKHCRFVLRFASVRCTLLVRDQEAPYKERVVDRHATEDATHLETRPGVLLRKLKELVSKVGGQENGPNWFSILKIGSRTESQSLLAWKGWRSL
jgi:hypothetical protein